MLASSHCWVILGVICGLSGCWQEIRYEPSSGNHRTATTKTLESTTAEPATNAQLSDLPDTSELVAEPTPQTMEKTDFLTVNTPTPAPESESPNEADPIEGVIEQDADLPAMMASNPLVAPDLDATELPNTTFAVWKMSSDWSMAAALQAKGKDLDAYGERLDRAGEEAQALGVQLPAFPNHTDKADRLQANIAFLLDDGGPELARQLQSQLGSEAAALSELATKTNVLLLSYSPKWTRLDAVVNSIRSTAEGSQLPEAVWGELVDLLSKRAAFQEVKASVFQLHRQAANYLSVATE